MEYHRVNFKGKNCVLTRLGFGLSWAPRIMRKTLKTILEQDVSMKGATDH